MMIIKETAYAKINLGLDVLGLRPDKYHEVAMVMQSVGLADTLTISENPELAVTCDNADLPAGPENLAWKAAVLMGQVANREPLVKIVLQKRIFVAAGLAGGSTDAAAVLRGLNRLWQLGLSLDKLERLGAKLGSDVPFCIRGGTSLATGRGELLTPLPDLPIQTVILAKPRVAVSTPWAYREFDKQKNVQHPDIQALVAAVQAQDLDGVLRACGNVLEPVTAAKHPVLREIKARMRDAGVLLALMSGSGPTMFGIAPDGVVAAKVAAALEGMNLELAVTHTTGRSGQV
jgi:4-diphosphocytidyl-2-C-methyl-D-erythritol kinase